MSCATIQNLLFLGLLTADWASAERPGIVIDTYAWTLQRSGGNERRLRHQHEIRQQRHIARLQLNDLVRQAFERYFAEAMRHVADHRILLVVVALSLCDGNNKLFSSVCPVVPRPRSTLLSFRVCTRRCTVAMWYISTTRRCVLRSAPPGSTQTAFGSQSTSCATTCWRPCSRILCRQSQ